MTSTEFNNNFSDENHILNYKEDFLSYLKTINPYTDVLVKNLDNIRDETFSKTIKVRPEILSFKGATTIWHNDKLMWLKTIEFKYWLAVLLQVNISSATELAFGYVCGLVHPMMPDINLMYTGPISHDGDYYELHVKFTF